MNISNCQLETLKEIWSKWNSGDANGPLDVDGSMDDFLLGFLYGANLSPEQVKDDWNEINILMDLWYEDYEHDLKYAKYNY